MFKLIKYEFKSNFKEFIGILATIIIGNLLLLTRKGVWENGSIVGISVAIAFAALVVIFIASIKFMSKYIYEDAGYLFFTLPQSGYSILGSRLILGLLETAAVTIVSYLFIRMNLKDDIMMQAVLTEVSTKRVLILGIVLSCINYIFTFTMIYFSMIAGKVALRNKKVGKFGSFILFIIISALDGYIGTKIKDLFPKEVSIGKIITGFTHNANGTELMNDIFSLNIGVTIFEVVVFIALFFGTVYLIDNKVDL